MIVFQVSLLESSYPILLGENLLSNIDLWQGFIGNRSFCIVTDEVVATLYLKSLAGALNADKYIVLPSGESHKNIETLTKILNYLTESHFPRDGILIALGGGVIGDMTGFAAAIYQRGIDFIQVPTTTLAMLDSSIGGKTAVNVGSAKNNVGAFHQPLAVVMDLSVLKSLDQSEFAAGLAEVIKHALIKSPELFHWMEKNKAAILECDSAILAEMIERSCNIKAAIVRADEKEQNIRMLLNFGHTFGHAIEAYSEYQDLKHGEAVAIGMMCALRYSQVNSELLQKVKALLEFFGLPTTFPKNYDHETLRGLMAHDKKKRQGLLNLVLLKDLGEAYIAQEELCKIHF